MSIELQRDIERVEACIENHVDVIDARDEWDRLKQRLTPDRERVARAIAAHNVGGSDLWPYWLDAADAAIDAMEGEPPSTPHGRPSE